MTQYHFPASEMEAWTIRKDFREAEDPMEPYFYEELPETQKL
jgi:hypothetical protein